MKKTKGEKDFHPSFLKRSPKETTPIVLEKLLDKTEDLKQDNICVVYGGY